MHRVTMSRPQTEKLPPPTLEGGILRLGRIMRVVVGNDGDVAQLNVSCRLALILT